MNPHWSVRQKPAAADPLKKTKVLYVDDDTHWLDVVAATLDDAGYEVLKAKDATEAMRLTEGINVGMIILDLNLGGEDGIVLMKFFKRNQPEAPIILFTGMSHDDKAILEMLRQGAHQYVRKGPLDDLRKVIQAISR